MGEHFTYVIFFILYNIGLRWDTNQPCCFKLGMMLNMTKLYTLTPVWMTLTFTQGHRIMGKLGEHAVNVL